MTGPCMLYCGRAAVPLQWVGSVKAPTRTGAILTGDLYACADCLPHLGVMVERHVQERDLKALTAR
ncbi:hypothetical protein [Streptomyces sp. NPDC014685]|uniref:hypothetical protein n=1 Tax=Streptomyces sp. NPDC014685 TaxID=3364881 RepID=UPI0036F790F4